VEKGSVKEKSYGKQKVYVYNQVVINLRNFVVFIKFRFTSWLQFCIECFNCKAIFWRVSNHVC